MRSMKSMAGLTMIMAAIAANMDNNPIQVDDKPSTACGSNLTKRQRKNRAKSIKGRKANRMRRLILK